MFNSIEEAIAFANKDDNDGGLPIFRYESEEVPNSDPVEYRDVVFVKIINKGDPKSVMDRPKRKEDEARWPQHWKAFLEGTEAPLNGIPLREFPMMTPASIAQCNSLHIRTVEELADYPDGQLGNLGSRGVTLKREAKKYLQYRAGPDVEALKARIAELEKKVGDDTDNVPERASGDGVPDSGDAGGKQQSGRKANTGARKKRRAKVSN